MSESKRKLELVKAAAATNGRVPISVDTTLRLSRLWFELQGANRAAQQAQVTAAQAAQAYAEGLSGVVEALDLGIEAVAALPGGQPGEQQLRVSVDFKARELVLPPAEPEQPTPTPAEGGA